MHHNSRLLFASSPARTHWWLLLLIAMWAPFISSAANGGTTAKNEVLVPYKGPSRINIIPKPAAVIEHEGLFTWSPGTPIIYDMANEELAAIVRQFCYRYTKATGAHLPTQSLLRQMRTLE